MLKQELIAKIPAQTGGLVYQIWFMPRKTVQLQVLKDQSVILKAPLKANMAELDRFVTQKLHWVQKKQAQFAKQPTPYAYTSGEQHFYLGQSYTLQIKPAQKQWVELHNSTLCLHLKDATTAEHCLYEWYRKQAHQIFPHVIGECWQTFQRYGFAKPSLRIKRLRSLWGSLSRKGNMNLNLELIRASIPCIEYVVFHELCHLKHPHHRPIFYEFLNEQLPNWKELEQQLKQTRL